MKVLLANTVEHAKHFTKQTTTVVFAGKTTLGKTVICVSDNHSFCIVLQCKKTCFFKKCDGILLALLNVLS